MQKVSNFSIVSTVIYIAFYLSLVRTTGISLFLPSDENLLGTVDYTVYTIQNYILLLLLTAYIFLNNNYQFVQTFFKSVLIMFLSGCIVLSLVFSDSLIVSIKFLITVIVISLPPIIFAQHVGINGLLRHLSYFVLIMVFANLLYTLAFSEYAIMSAAHAGRWKGLFEHKNGFGPFFAVGFFILANRLSGIWTVRGLITLLAMMICFVFVVKSGSATAVICFGLLAILVLILIFAFKLQPAGRIALFAVIGSVLPVMIFFVGPVISEIIFEATGRDATLTGRTRIWDALMEGVWERPIFGYGAGMAFQPSFISQFHSEIGFEAATAHNSFIDVMLNFGIPFTIIVCLLIARILFKGLFTIYDNKRDIYNNALACGLIAIVIAVSFSSSGAIIGRSVLWMYFVIAALILLKKPLTRRQHVSQVSHQKNDLGLST